MEFLIEQDEKEQIEKIIGGLKCQKGFECYKSGFASLCKVKDIGLDSLLICLDGKAQKCKFATSLGDYQICKCPLRLYIAKNLRK